MHTLVVSDTHLLSFDRGKYVLLAELVQQAQQVILNGDFWEGHFQSFDTFIHSPWQQLFPLLKSKETIYIVGNHDKAHFSDVRVLQFCTQKTDRYELCFGQKKYIFEHGNQYVLTIDNQNHIPNNASLVQKCTEWTQSHISSTNIYKHHGYKVVQKILKAVLNEKLIRHIAPRLAPQEYFFFGHTHAQHADHAHRIYNSGVFNYGLAQWITIEHPSGNIILHTRTY